MSRRIELDINKNDRNAAGFYTNFDDYGVILYYAYTIDQVASFQLYKAMVSEYYYRIGYDLPLEGLTEQDTKVHLPINQLNTVISFINNNIIPTLQTLPLDLDLTKSWNVGSSLEVFLMSKDNFFETFAVDDIVIDGYTVSYFIATFIQLNNFFQEAVNNNATYDVSIV